MKKNGLHTDSKDVKRWYKAGKLHRENGPAVIFLDGEQWWFKNGKLHREDGPAVIDPYGTQEWWKEGEWHREDGPAIIYPDGRQWWYKEGKRYEPSVKEIEAYERKMKTSKTNKIKNGLHTDSDGTQVWYKEGERHREDGPAIILSDGMQRWFKEGEFHREDGPAIIYPDGRQEWYKKGELHREDGPAIIYPDGRQWWYKEGKRYEPSVKEIEAYERKMKGEQGVATNADIFYMVFNPLRGAPTVRHTSLETAEAEAERIAAKHDEPVYVLKSVCKFARVTPPIQKTIIQ